MQVLWRQETAAGGGDTAAVSASPLLQRGDRSNKTNQETPSKGPPEGPPGGPPEDSRGEGPVIMPGQKIVVPLRCIASAKYHSCVLE